MYGTGDLRSNELPKTDYIDVPSWVRRLPLIPDVIATIDLDYENDRYWINGQEFDTLTEANNLGAGVINGFGVQTFTAPIEGPFSVMEEVTMAATAAAVGVIWQLTDDFEVTDAYSRFISTSFVNRLIVNDKGVAQINDSTRTLVANTRYRIMHRFATNAYALHVQNIASGAAVSDTGCIIPSVTRLAVGKEVSNGTVPFLGTIHRLSFLPAVTSFTGMTNWVQTGA